MIRTFGIQPLQHFHRVAFIPVDVVFPVRDGAWAQHYIDHQDADGIRRFLDALPEGFFDLIALQQREGLLGVDITNALAAYVMLTGMGLHLNRGVLPFPDKGHFFIPVDRAPVFLQRFPERLGDPCAAAPYLIGSFYIAAAYQGMNIKRRGIAVAGI